MDPSWVCWIGIIWNYPHRMGIKPNQALLIYSKISDISEIFHFLSLPKKLQNFPGVFRTTFFGGTSPRGHLWRVPAPLLWAKWRWPLGLRNYPSPEAGWSWTASMLALSNLFSLVVGDILSTNIGGHVWTNYAKNVGASFWFNLTHHPWIGTWGSSSMIGGDSWGGNQAHFVDLRDFRTMPLRETPSSVTTGPQRC